jgi:hypothetical protein
MYTRGELLNRDGGERISERCLVAHASEGRGARWRQGDRVTRRRCIGEFVAGLAAPLTQ